MMQLPSLQTTHLPHKCKAAWGGSMGGYCIAGLFGHGDAFVMRDPSGIRCPATKRLTSVWMCLDRPHLIGIGYIVPILCLRKPPIMSRS
eukprot:3291689-Amphidinium_carterae.1